MNVLLLYACGEFQGLIFGERSFVERESAGERAARLPPSAEGEHGWVFPCSELSLHNVSCVRWPAGLQWRGVRGQSSAILRLMHGLQDVSKNQ